jgi:hypothetical protein
MKYQGLLRDDTTFIVLRNQQKTIWLWKPCISKVRLSD